MAQVKSVSVNKKAKKIIGLTYSQAQGKDKAAIKQVKGRKH